MAQIVTLQQVDAAKLDIYNTLETARSIASGLNNWKNSPAENRAFEAAFRNAATALNNFVTRAGVAMSQGIGSSVVIPEDLVYANDLVERYYDAKQRAFNVYNSGTRWSGQEKYFRAYEKLHNLCTQIRDTYERIALGEGIDGDPGSANVTVFNRTPMYFILGAIGAFVVFLIWIKKRK